MNTAERIRKFRKEQNLTQIELSQKAGIAVNTLRLYEGGKRQPRIKQLQCLANALNIPVSELSDSVLYQDVMPPEGGLYYTQQAKSTTLYPTEKDCAILCMTMADDFVHIMLNYPMVPMLKQVPWRISKEDMEDLETLLHAYCDKHEGVFPPEIGAGIKLILNLLTEKSKCAAGIPSESNQQAVNNEKSPPTV